jgi:hypothetical protein
MAVAAAALPPAAASEPARKPAERSVCKMPKPPASAPITDSGPGAAANAKSSPLSEKAAANAAEASKEKENVLPRYYYTQKEFWGGTTLSYTMYTILALIPITGFLGLDHMYMRSPGTGFMKFLMNFFTLGFWYFYDVIQAVTEQEDVRSFGVSMPLYGPSGIGAGSFGSEEEPVRDDNGSAGNFLWFCFASFFLPFGVEYLIAGDIGGFLCKFIGTLFFIGLIYGLINNMKLLNHPERVMCEGLPRYAPFTWFDVEETFTNTAFRNKLSDNCPPAEGAVGGWFGGIFSNLITKVPGLSEIYQTAMGVKDAARQVGKQAVEGLGTAQNLVGKAAGVGAKLAELQAAAAGAGGAGGIMGGVPGKGPTTPAAQAQGTAAARPAAEQAQGISLLKGGGSAQESNSNRGVTSAPISGGFAASNTILGFTLALVFLGAFFTKGKDAIAALANRGEEKPPAFGTRIIRSTNEPALPPESGVF